MFVVTCPLVNLTNGQEIPDKTPVNGHYPNGTIISFSCNSGYTLDTTQSGSSSSTICLFTGDWSHSVPECRLSNTTLFQFLSTDLLCPKEVSLLDHEALGAYTIF